MTKEKQHQIKIESVNAATNFIAASGSVKNGDEMIILAEKIYQFILKEIK